MREPLAPAPLPTSPPPPPAAAAPPHGGATPVLLRRTPSPSCIRPHPQASPLTVAPSDPGAFWADSPPPPPPLRSKPPGLDDVEFVPETPDLQVASSTTYADVVKRAPPVFNLEHQSLKSCLKSAFAGATSSRKTKRVRFAPGPRPALADRCSTNRASGMEKPQREHGSAGGLHSDSGWTQVKKRYWWRKDNSSLRDAIFNLDDDQAQEQDAALLQLLGEGAPEQQDGEAAA
ncbi:hypothetical protein ACP70R_016451 [Stipagrostis hirtigluma subsp. patula]